jgi:hypothetical protein
VPPLRLARKGEIGPADLARTVEERDGLSEDVRDAPDHRVAPRSPPATGGPALYCSLGQRPSIASLGDSGSLSDLEERDQLVSMFWAAPATQPS